MRQWRKRHRCLSTAEIAERIKELGGVTRASPKGLGRNVETISLDSASGQRQANRMVYRDWLSEAS